MQEKTKLLNPKIDVVFQALFGEQGSERITKAFLEKILDIKIEEIELNQNPILRRNKLNDKLGVLDVIAKINTNQNVDIEMQMSKKENIIDRILYYWSRMYVRSIKKKEDYEVLEKSIVILITEDRIEGLEELKCHTEWKIIESKKRAKILTDKFEIHIIELEKLNNDINSVSVELLDWLAFLQNPESERVKKSMKKNVELKEAIEKLEKISEDEQMQQLAWWREKGVYEENERKRIDKRIAEGEKRIAEGEKRIAEGKKRIAEGKKRIAEGEKRIAEGEKKLADGMEKLNKKEEELYNNKKEFAKKLKVSGISIEEIVKYTQLTREEIEQLK